MTLLGLDFDNTIVSYDKLFHKLAVEKGLIDQTMPKNKRVIRDFLRREGKDHDFSLLQGEAYGPRILDSEKADGVFKALKKITDNGIKMVIISHKTMLPYFGPKYDLHAAARKWLKYNSFTTEEGLGIKSEQVYFEPTKKEKVKRIESLGCTHYIDDLPEILEMINPRINRILYREGIDHGEEDKEYTVLKKWSELSITKDQYSNVKKEVNQ